jgi:hypothetical protein
MGIWTASCWPELYNDWYICWTVCDGGLSELKACAVAARGVHTWPRYVALLMVTTHCFFHNVHVRKLPVTFASASAVCVANANAFCAVMHAIASSVVLTVTILMD